MRYILFFLLFLLPFIVIPYGSSQFEVPKVISAEIGIELLLFISLLTYSPSDFLQKEVFPIVGLFVLSLIHILFFSTDISFFGNAFRHQGIFLFWNLILLYFLARKISLPPIIYWLTPVLLGIQLIATEQIGTTVTGRAIGTLGEPNALAAYAIALWPFMLCSKITSNHRIVLATSVFMLTAILIFLSGSRSGALALIIQLVFVIMIFSKKISFQKSVLLSCILFLISLITPFITPQNAYENRVEVWKTAFWGGFERPVFGGGFGNIEKIFHSSAVRINLPIQYYYVDSSHNIFLDFWFQGGILGLSCFLILLWQSIQNFIKQKNTFGITLLLGLLTVMSFNPVSVVTLVVFWWLLGFSFQAQNRQKNSSA